MKDFRPLDLDTFTSESNTVIDFIADYYRRIEQYPVRSQVDPNYLPKLLPDSPPQTPESLESILDDIRAHILPGMTHWQSPTFFAYYVINASTAGFLGEMLCSGLNSVPFNWISSPAATELESLVMDWAAKLIDLPSAFQFSSKHGGGGVIQGITCEAVVCTLAAARDRALKDRGHDFITKLVVYSSDQTHSMAQKGAKIVGIPPSNFRVISTSSAFEYALTAESLRAAIESDIAKGMIPVFVCATVGTTGVCAVDPLRDLGEVANEYGIWLHVDAAYAGSAAVCPEFRHYFDGIELADSLSMNPHKWLLTNLDCCCLWVKNSNLLIESLSMNPEYLGNNATDSKAVIDYKDWQIPLARRFRAMKLWMVMRRYGTENLMRHIRSDVAMAERFERMVKEDERFEVVVPRRFGLVCFRLMPKREGDDGFEINRRLLENVNASGKAFMTHTVVDGLFVIRFVVGTTLTEVRHVDATWQLIQAIASEII